ncbi:hypothetical protein [Gemmobacter sp.]|uniref:hypothetical protein n=1 Tax=Gemmobacter sp. TaxID=1898957 RepID=UPI002AFFBA5A|nr:hypothetical protein [Gemmobacter sp.]
MLRLALLIWLLITTGAMAQVVTVRSGEHGDFTRLVLTFPEPGGWDFGRTGDGYGFRSRAGGWRYDISTVFSLIPRDRLAALWVDPDSGVLRLGLGCACHAIAAPFRPGIVVLDIRPGVAPDGSPFEQALEGAGRPLPQLAARPLLRPRARPGDFRPPPSEPLPPWYLAGPRNPSPAAFAAPDPRAAGLQAGLVRELSRGIAAGALTPAIRPAPAKATPASGPRLLPAPPQPVSVQMRLPAEDEAGGKRLSDQGMTCIADNRLDLPAWGSDDPPASQIARARSRLLGEFDRPDPAQVLALARLYLHLGFGAEARALLALWPTEGDDSAVLEALAILVDGGLEDVVFPGMASCDSRAALWSVLGNPAPPGGTGTNTAAVIRAFSELPPVQRQHLGLALADRFLVAGDRPTAQAIRAAIDRAGEGSGVALIDARLDRESGVSAAAETRLADVARRDPALAPRAVADLVNSRIQRGEPPDADTILELEALLREHRGSAEAPTLRRALAQALVVTGNADRALRDLTAEDPDLAPQLWTLLAERGEEMDLVSRALADTAAARTLPGQVRQAVAQRLIAAGFPQAADPWLAGLPGVEATLARATAALALRDGRLALRELAGNTGPESDRLRAQALESLGDLAGAQAAWVAAGEPDQADRLRFLDRRWLDLTATSGPVATLTADLAPPPAPDPALGELARGQALLTGSAATRGAATALLRDRPAP